MARKKLCDYTNKELCEKEYKNIKKVFENLPNSTALITDEMIKRIAFMVVTLTQMEEKINNDGLVEDMEQGSYTIKRAHPLLTTYNAMIKNYNTAFKTVLELLPPSDQEIAGSALMNFVTKKAEK